MESAKVTRASPVCALILPFSTSKAGRGDRTAIAFPQYRLHSFIVPVPYYIVASQPVKKFILSLPLAFLVPSGVARADDIGSVRKKAPEFTATVPLSIFDIERCIIDTDNIGKPWVYRQPDRPNEVMLVWESSDFGDATVLEMRMDGNSTSLKFWGRNKAWRKAQPCIGRNESDVP